MIGLLKHVSASGRGFIWGVNRNNDVWMCAKPCDSSAWTQVFGMQLVQVSGGETHVWGVDTSDRIYRRPVDGSGTWQQMNGLLKQVSASGNGFIWGVNRNNEIWKCTKPCDSSAWKNVPGRLTQVSGGDTHVWGVDPSGLVYRMEVDGSASTWEKMRGDGFKHVAASGAGRLWGVNTNDQILHGEERPDVETVLQLAGIDRAKIAGIRVAALVHGTDSDSQRSSYLAGKVIGAYSGYPAPGRPLLAPAYSPFGRPLVSSSVFAPFGSWSLPWRAVKEDLLESGFTHIYVTDDGADGDPWDSLPFFLAELF